MIDKMITEFMLNNAKEIDRYFITVMSRDYVDYDEDTRIVSWKKNILFQMKTLDRVLNEKDEWKLKAEKYEDFYNHCACLFAEGVEFMTKEQIYESIKKE
jgi:hypothetical protein